MRDLAYCVHGAGHLFSARRQRLRPRLRSPDANRAARERSPGVCRSDTASSRSVPSPPKGPDQGSVVEHGKVKHCEGPDRNPVASLSFPLRGTCADTSLAVWHASACLAGIAGIGGSLHEPHRAGQCRYSVRRSIAALGRSVSRSVPGAGSAHTRTLGRRPSLPPCPDRKYGGRRGTKGRGPERPASCLNCQSVSGSDKTVADYATARTRTAFAGETASRFAARPADQRTSSETACGKGHEMTPPRYRIRSHPGWKDLANRPLPDAQRRTGGADLRVDKAPGTHEMPTNTAFRPRRNSSFSETKLLITYQAQLPVARPRWHGVRRLRGDLAAGLTVVMPASATFRARPAIVSAPGLSLVRNQDEACALRRIVSTTNSFIPLDPGCRAARQPDSTAARQNLQRCAEEAA